MDDLHQAEVVRAVHNILQLRPKHEDLKRDLAAAVELAYVAKQVTEQKVKDSGLTDAQLLQVSIAIEAATKWVLAREKYESRFPEGVA